MKTSICQLFQPGFFSGNVRVGSLLLVKKSRILRSWHTPENVLPVGGDIFFLTTFNVAIHETGIDRPRQRVRFSAKSRPLQTFCHANLPAIIVVCRRFTPDIDQKMGGT